MINQDKINYIGKDLLDTYPYNCIGVIEKKEENTISHYTGTLISKNLVLTSALAVYNKINFSISLPQDISFKLLSEGNEYIKAKRISGCQNYAKLYENQIINKTQETLLPLNDYAIIELEKDNDCLTVFPELKLSNDKKLETKILIIGSFSMSSIEKNGKEYAIFEEIFKKNCLIEEDSHLFTINTDFHLEDNLISYNQNELNHLNKGGPIFVIDKEKKLPFIIGNNQDQATGCPVSENHFKVIRKLNQNLIIDDEVKRTNRKSPFELKGDFKNSIKNSKFMYKTQNTFVEKSFNKEKNEKNEKLFQRILEKEKDSTKLDNIAEKINMENEYNDKIGLQVDKNKFPYKKIDKNLMENKTMTPSIYKKSVIKFNNNITGSKEKDTKKVLARTPTNTNKNNLINNKTIKINTQKMNSLLKSTTVKPSKKMNINIEKPFTDVKTDRQKKSNPQASNHNANWNINPIDKNKKEIQKNNKFIKKSPNKLTKKNSKTPKNGNTNKNIFENKKGTEIDKLFLSSLTGNLQSLISNIEVIEKVTKKNIDQHTQNVK